MTAIQKQQARAQIFLASAMSVIQESDFYENHESRHQQQTPLEFSASVDPEDEAKSTYHIFDAKGYRTLPPGREISALKP